MSDDLSKELERVLNEAPVPRGRQAPFVKRGPIVASFERDTFGDGTRLILSHDDRQVRAAVPRLHEKLPVSDISLIHLQPAVDQLW